MKTGNFKKALLASSALMALSFVPLIAQATTVTVNGSNVSITTDPAATPSIDYLTDNTATVNSGVNLTGTVITGTADTGTLTLSGTSTVTGDIGDTNALKVLNISGASGATDTFNGNVNAQTINYLNTSATKSTINFNGNVTGNIIYSGTGQTPTLNMDSGTDLIGSVDNTNSAGGGVFSLLGGTQFVTGDIGDTNAITLLRAGAIGANDTFEGKVNGGTNFIGTGTVTYDQGTLKGINFNGFDGNAIIAAGGNVGSNIVTSAATNPPDDIGTVTFAGGNQTVNGNVGGNTILKVINLGYNGATTTFAGFAGAYNFNMMGNGTVNFESYYRGNFNFDGFNGVLNQLIDGGNAFGGNYTTTVADTGIINATGTTLLAGTVGVGDEIKALNAGANGKNVAITGVVDANDITVTGSGNIDFQGGANGAIHLGSNNGSIQLDSGQIITGNIDTSVSDTGTVNLYQSTVNGNIGSSALAINTLYANTGGGAVTVNGTVNAQNISMVGLTTLNLNGNTTGNLTMDSDNGTLVLADGVNFTGNIETGGPNVGTLNLLGSSTISGMVGDVQPLLAVNAGANGATDTFNGAVNAQNINVTGTGTLAFANSVTGNLSFGGNDGTITVADTQNLAGTVDTTVADTGTLTLLGSSTVSGTIGGTQALKTVNAGATGATDTFSGAVNAQSINVTGTGSVLLNGGATGAIGFNGDGVVNLANNQNITGSVDTAVADTGTLTLLGSSTISGAVGDAPLKVVNAGANGATDTFSGAVNAQNINVTGTGTVLLNGGATGAIGFGGNDGIVTLADAQSITGTVDTTVADTGTLTLLGSSTVSGTIGGTQALKTVNAGATGATDTFSGAVNAQNINVTGTGSVLLNGGATGAIGFNGDGVVNLANNQNITGSVDTAVADTGTLNVLGTSTVSGLVGGTNALKEVSAGADGATVTFQSLVNAQTLNILGNGNILMDGGSTTSNIAFAGNGTLAINSDVTGNLSFGGNDGTITVADTQNLAGTVDTTVADTGTLTLLGSSTVSGTIGGTQALKTVNAGATGATDTFSGAVNAQNINVTGTGSVLLNGGATGAISFNGDGVVNLANNQNITGSVDTAVADTGTLNVLGTSTVSGLVGGTNALKEVSAGADGATVTFQSLVNAQTLNILGNGNILMDGGSTTSNIAFAGNGTLAINSDVTGNLGFGGNNGTITLADAQSITGTVDTTVADTGTLTLLGSSTVSGTIGGTQALKTVNAGATGATDTFSGAVNAQSINVTGTGSVLLNGGATGAIGFNGDGVVNLANNQNITGSVDTAVADTGTLTLLGSSTISGAVGDAPLKVVNAGANGATDTFSGAVNAQNINVTGTGTVLLNGGATGAIGFGGNDGIVTLADAQSITGTVDTTVADTGTLTLLGSSTVSGTIGGTQALKTVNAGATGATDTFSGAVNAQNINVTGTGSVLLNGGATGAIGFNGDGVVNLANNQNITGSVDTAVADTGTLNVLGTSTVSGLVGGTNALKEVSAGADGATVTFQSLVNAQTLNILGNGNILMDGGSTTSNIAFAGNGTLAINSDVTGNLGFGGNNGTITLADAQSITGTVDTTVADTGTLTLLGSSTVSGTIGGTQALKTVNAGATGATDTFSGAVNAQSINVTGTGSVLLNGGATGAIGFNGDGVVNLANNQNITGSVDTAVADTGTLTLLGSSTISGAVGDAPLKVVNAGANGATDTFSGAVNAQNINVTGTGTVLLNGGATGAIGFGGNDGIVTLADAQSITGTVDTTVADTGTLTLLGSSTVSGTIGGTQALKTVNAGATGATDTFSGAVNAQNINVTGTGSVLLNGGATGAIGFNGDGVVNLANNQNITGSVDTAVADTGTLNVLGTSTVSGLVGGTNALKEVSAGADGATVTFQSLVNAQTLNILGNGNILMDGGSTTSNIAFAGNGTLAINSDVTGNLSFGGNDGTITVADTQNLAGTVDTTVADTGTLTLLGSSTVSGTIGGTQALKTVNAGATGATDTFSGAVNAQNINVTGTGSVLLNGGATGAISFNGDGVVNLANNQNITGSVDTAVADTGTLNVLGTSTVSGLVGGTNALKEVSAGADGATVTFQSLVNAQTLNILGNGNILMDGGSTTSNIAFAGNGTLTVDNSVSENYTNNITGGGQLVKNGVGALTLSGANTYTGGTQVNDGLIIGNTSSIVGNYTLSGGGLTFDQDTDGAYAGNLNGIGALQKTGAGSVSLAGDGSGYTGTTEIANGTLAFNSNYGGTSVLVDSGATLAGSGNVGNVQIASGGHFAPGNFNAINTGNVTFASGSNYDVQINAAGQSNTINANGTVNINGGTVNVNGAAGTYGLSTNYTIINATTVNGAFTNVTDNLAFLDPTLLYTGNSVKLQMNRNDVDFSSVGSNPALGAAINALGAGNPIYDEFTKLTAQQAQNALNALNNTNAGIAESSSLVTTTVNARIDTLSHSGDVGNTAALAALAPSAGGDGPIQPVAPSRKLWSQLMGSLGHSDANASADTAKQSRDSYGVLAGLDTDIESGGYYGFFAGYEDGNINSTSAKSQLDNYHVGAYAMRPLTGGFNLSGGLTGTYHDIASQRDVEVGMLNYAPHSQSNAYSTSAFVTVKKAIDFDAFALEPYAGFSVNYSYTDAYNEEGGGPADLAVNSTQTVNPASVLGMRFGKALSNLNLNASLGWQHTFGDLHTNVTQRFISGSSDFSATGIPQDSEAALVGFGFDSVIYDSITAYAAYDGTYSASAIDHSFKGGLKYAF